MESETEDAVVRDIAYLAQELGVKGKRPLGALVEVNQFVAQHAVRLRSRAHCLRAGARGDP